MLVRCWGSRGSIPVCGKDYIKYGGDTTCIEVRGSKGELIIIDAGTGIRRLGARLVDEGVSGIHILLTHSHWDHLLGFPFFKPLYVDSSKIHVYGYYATQDSVRNIISKTMRPPYFPVRLDDIHAEINFHTTEPEGFYIGSILVKTIPLNHTNRGVGYRLEEEGRSFVFLTDNELNYNHPCGLSYEEYERFSAGADLLFHDAEYTPSDYMAGWGHSIYTDALRLAIRSGVKKFGLFHHNQERKDDEIDSMVADCRRVLEEEGSTLDVFAVATDIEITL